LATAERLRNALVKDLPAILEAVVRSAKNGDINAAKTILERVLPPLKAAEVPVVLDAIRGTPTEQGAAVLQAMVGGTLTPSQGAQLMSAVTAHVRILEVAELVRRLEQLERKLESDGHGGSERRPETLVAPEGCRR
jgi:hypothetical protein